MLLSIPSSPQPAIQLSLIEGGLTCIVLLAAFALPRTGAGLFQRIERAFARVACRKNLSIAVVGGAAALLRLALLPLFPIPLPIIPDEFSYLLAANTFASGRLTNPTPAMWTHFESIQISMTPTYMSMYFPGQGLVLALGKLLFGHPWFGLLLATSLACAAICWMLQAWLPSRWALLGGFIAVFHFALFSHWINTYIGSSSVSALGGALVLGALPRLKRSLQTRDGLLLAAGIVILALSRPYEGLLLCAPVAVALSYWAFFGMNRPSLATLLRRSAAPVALLVFGACWLAYYDYRLFENPFTLPYVLHRAQYAVAPTFVWQHLRPTPIYRHKAMEEFYTRNEVIEFQKVRTLPGFFTGNLAKLANCIYAYAGFALLIPLLLVSRVFFDRRLRFLVLCMFILMAGMLAEAVLLPYYVAPFTAAFFAIRLQAMRHLRLWKPGGQPVGLAMLRGCVTLVIAMALVQVAGQIFRQGSPRMPNPAWSCDIDIPCACGTERANIEAALASLPGKQLVLVRYSDHHRPLNEWVYNDPDIDASRVIWAHDMDTAANRELINYYKDRTVWLVTPDVQPVEVAPYSASANAREWPDKAKTAD